MASIFFLLFILAAIGTVICLMIRSSLKQSAQLAKKAASRPKVSKVIDDAIGANMVTPGNNILSHNEEIWETRRKHAQNISKSSEVNRGHLKYEEESEYDGYSRRDRRHISPAHIKEEEHCENLTMSTIEFKPVKDTHQARTGGK